MVLGLPLSVMALAPAPALAQEAAAEIEGVEASEPDEAEIAETEDVAAPAIQDETPVPEIEVESPRVLISEVLIEGLDGHPELDRLQVQAYDAMQVRPGSRVTREELQRDLNAIQATGWFSDVRITPVQGPLGVQVIVQLEPFPALTAVNLDPSSDLLPQSVIE